MCGTVWVASNYSHKERSMSGITRRSVSKFFLGAESVWDWVHFYRVLFGYKLSNLEMNIPHRQSVREGQTPFDLLTLIAQGTTIHPVINVSRNFFGVVWFAESKVVDRNDRTPDRTYSIWSQRLQDGYIPAPPSRSNVLGPGSRMTLLEFLVMNLMHYIRHEKPVGPAGFTTLCSGSVLADGRTPSVKWNEDKNMLMIVSQDPDSVLSSGGPRLVIC